MTTFFVVLSVLITTTCSAFGPMQAASSPFVWSSTAEEHGDNASRLEQLATARENLSKAKMIVFDKDGTLGDDVASLKRWALHMTERLEERMLSDKDKQQQLLLQEFHATIGWDPIAEVVVPSAPLAAGTWDEQVVTVQNLLNKYNLDDEETLAAQWHLEMDELHGADKPLIPNLREMLLDCQQRGLIVAICTSDERTSTDKALNFWNVNDVTKYSICGDEVETPKPSAQPLELLCAQVDGVSPHECIIVGDTISDSGMARNANALFCIGVLTGSGTPEILTETGADIILPSVADIPALLSAMGRPRV